MENDAARVDPNGCSFKFENKEVYVSWIDKPHFYKSGRLIVIYIGQDKTITSLLEDILGKQFAG